MSEAATLLTLGGSGENGRNCYLLSTKEGCILLDCGVKRTVTPEAVGEYPLLTPELAARIQAVFLSHAHEDHCAALPLLYALGFSGTIYGSRETIDGAPRMIRKWMTFVESQGGILPYTQAEMDRIRFSVLEPGESRIGSLRILTGRSGHTAGSLWISIGWKQEGWQLFYSGDMCLCSSSLACDMPPVCDHALLNCAYAGRNLQQDEQYRLLHLRAHETLARGGKLLLPVPPTGRGCDMLLSLASAFPDAPIFAAESIVLNARSLLKDVRWLRAGLPEETLLDRIHPLKTQEDYSSACSGGPGILLVTDGMLTTPEGLLCLHLLGGYADHRVILTGHAAPGTAAGNLLDPDRRAEQRLAIEAEMLTIKVHLDDADALTIQHRLQSQSTVLFHAPAAHCLGTIKAFTHAGASCACLMPGEHTVLDAAD